MHRLAMTIHVTRHCERRVWDKPPAKKSDDDTGRRHCERSEAIQKQATQSGLLCSAYNDEPRNPVIARHEAIQIQATQSGLLRSATNDEFCKLVNFSVFEKSIFSSGSRNDELA